MPGILSAEHSARIASWDDTRRQAQKSKKLSNRAKLIGFVIFNLAIWFFLAKFLWA